MTPSTETGGQPLLPRITTGNRALDDILGGGFPVNSITIVMGEPGTGKTILAESIMFWNAGTDNRPCLYLTTLSEPLEKVVRYLQQFSFFDVRKLGSAILYESLGEEMATQGISALATRIRDALKTLHPKIIVVDSFKVIHDIAANTPDLRRMLYDLAGLLSAYDTSAFLIGEYSEEHVKSFPEFAVADGMVELSRKLGARDERFLRVLKLRGSSYREGRHAFRISESGLEVYPRLVTPAFPVQYEVRHELLPTGVSGLDRMFGGGLQPGRSTFLLGPTGSGKTTLGLQFALEGIRRAEKSLYLNLEENPSQLASQIAALGVDPRRAQEQGLELVYASPVELQIDSLVARVFSAIRDRQVRRVVLDGVGDLIVAAEDERRLHGYLYSLLQHFATTGVTSIFTYQTRIGASTPELMLSALADNIIHLSLDLGERTRRRVRILKARATDHDLALRELEITRQGVQVR